MLCSSSTSGGFPSLALGLECRVGVALANVLATAFRMRLSKRRISVELTKSFSAFPLSFWIGHALTSSFSIRRFCIQRTHSLRRQSLDFRVGIELVRLLAHSFSVSLSKIWIGEKIQKMLSPALITSLGKIWISVEHAHSSDDGQTSRRAVPTIGEVTQRAETKVSPTILGNQFDFVSEGVSFQDKATHDLDFWLQTDSANLIEDTTQQRIAVVFSSIPVLAISVTTAFANIDWLKIFAGTRVAVNVNVEYNVAGHRTGSFGSESSGEPVFPAPARRASYLTQGA